MPTTVSINIVIWNPAEMEFLRELLVTIAEQTFRDFSVLVIDNGSGAGVDTLLRQYHPEVTLIRNARNLGFSTAHNQGMRYATQHWDGGLHDRYVLVTNPDTILTPTFLEELVASARRHPRSGSVGGKLLRAFGENLADDVLKETVRSQYLDSTGLRAHRNGTFTDRGAGEMDEGQFDAEETVFGLSGALVLYRASALEAVRTGDEFFDKDFFAYKEDVDLAWRLQRLGWDAVYASRAVAYHYRGMYGRERAGFWDKIRNRRAKSPVRNFFSTRNQWLTLMKNLSFVDAIVLGLWIVPYEFARLLFGVVFESSGRRAVIEALRLFPAMWCKRRTTFSRATRSGREVRRWFR